MRAHPLVKSYTVLEEDGNITVEMGMSYDCKTFYASITGTDVGVNSMYIEHSNPTYDGGYYDVKLTPEQAEDVYEVVSAKLNEVFEKKYSK